MSPKPLSRRCTSTGTTGEIVEITGVIALFGFLNRWNDSMATELEDPAAADGTRWLAGRGWIAGKHAT